MPYKVGMNRIAKVPLFGNLAKAVVVNTDATAGAKIGTDLLMPDGTLATTAKLQSLLGTGAQAQSAITTTDDLDEGRYNLYFTDRRAQDAVGSILESTGSIALTYEGGTSITADLKDLDDSGEGTFELITRDAQGRVSGTKNGSTSDVPEGDNLYFTATRVYAASKSQIVPGTNIGIEFDDDAKTITVSSTVPVGTFPFFLSDTTQANIALSSSNKLPFFLSNGSESDIALAA